MDMTIGAIPTAPYTSPTAFAHDWRSLPHELKLNILSYVLVGNDAFARNDFGINIIHWSHSLRNNAPYEFQDLIDYGCLQDLLSLSLGALEIIPLARDVFYGKNQIKICMRGLGHTLPSLATRNLILKLILDLWATSRDWIFLESFSRGVFGFERVQELTIGMHGAVYCAEKIVEIDALARLLGDHASGVFFNVRKLEVSFTVESRSQSLLDANFAKLSTVLFDRTGLAKITENHKLREDWKEDDLSSWGNPHSKRRSRVLMRR